LRRPAHRDSILAADGPEVASFAVMTMAAKKQRAQKTLLFVVFNVASIAFVTWFLSWTNNQ
jgi:hypothetical protein